MSIRTEVRQNIDKLADSTAFHVAAGAGDLAAEKLRKVQDRLAELDVQAALADVPQRLAVAGEKAQATLAAVPEKLAAMRAEPKAVQEAVQERAKQLPDRAQDLAAQFAGLAVQTYSELAERGRAVVGRLRNADAGGSGGTVARAEIVETGADVDGRTPTGKPAARPAKKSASRPAKAAAESRPRTSRTTSASKPTQKSSAEKH